MVQQMFSSHTPMDCLAHSLGCVHPTLETTDLGHEWEPRHNLDWGLEVKSLWPFMFPGFPAPLRTLCDGFFLLMLHKGSSIDRVLKHLSVALHFC